MSEKQDVPNEKSEAKVNPVSTAKLYSDTSKLAALTSHAIIRSEDVQADISTLHNEITAYLRMTLSGDPHDQEAILIAQSKTLDLLFNSLMGKAVTGRSLEQMTVYMDAALKVQNQCRKTVVALQNLKHPAPQTYIRQQNLALNQQINNGEIGGEEIKFQNELLSTEGNHAALESRGTSTTVKIDPRVVSLETVHGR